MHTGVEPNLIKAKSSYLAMQIFKKDKLHIVDVTDGFVESLGSVQISLT